MADLDSMMAEVIDGDADAATLTRLADQVRTDAAVRERFLAQVAIAGALRARHLPATQLAGLRQRILGTLVNADDLAHTERSVLERLPLRPSPRARRSWWIPAGLVAAAAFFMLTLLLPGIHPAQALLDAGTGATVERQGLTTPITPRMELRNGDRLASGPQEMAVFFADGTLVSMSSDTVLILERVADSKRVRLEQGNVHLHVATQPAGEPLLALTSRTTVTVVGTQFQLATAADSDFVAVHLGVVTVQRTSDGALTKLTGGRAVVIGKDQLLTTIPVAALDVGQHAGALTSAGWNGTGTGLRGDYYADHNFTRLAGSRVDPQIRFDWPGAPLDTMPTDHFTVRWTGRIQPRVSGVHTFTIRADDGVRLWIDGRVLIDTWHRPDIGDQRGGITLEAGRLYDLRLDYFDNNQAGEITLWWQAAGQAKEIVPASQLYPPP